MKILSVSHSFHPESTGVGNVATSLVREWLAAGHDVSVVTSVPPPGVRASEEIARTKRFHCSGNLVRGMRGEIDGYRRYLMQLRPDIIVVHCAQVWCIDSLFSIADRLPCPVVLLSHGLSAYGSPEYAEYFATLARFCQRGVSVVSLSSRLEETSFCAQHGLPRPTIIPNGVVLAEWDQRPRNVRARWRIGGVPWVISVSNHSTVKNHGAFWRILDFLRLHCPQVHGSIIGRPYVADRRLARALRVKGGCWYACCARSVWQRNVSMHTDVPRPDVVSAVQEADLLLVTSHREAAPLILLECMAAGTPWISLSLGAVADCAGGVVVDSLAEMERVAAELLSRPDEARKLATAGRAAVVGNHAWPKIAAQHTALYASILTTIVDAAR